MVGQRYVCSLTVTPVGRKITFSSSERDREKETSKGDGNRSQTRMEWIGFLQLDLMTLENRDKISTESKLDQINKGIIKQLLVRLCDRLLS